MGDIHRQPNRSVTFLIWSHTSIWITVSQHSSKHNGDYSFRTKCFTNKNHSAEKNNSITQKTMYVLMTFNKNRLAGLQHLPPAMKLTRKQTSPGIYKSGALTSYRGATGSSGLYRSDQPWKVTQPKNQFHASLEWLLTTLFSTKSSKWTNNKPPSNKTILLNVHKETTEGRAFCRRMLYQRQNNTSVY